VDNSVMGVKAFKLDANNGNAIVTARVIFCEKKIAKNN